MVTLFYVKSVTEWHGNDKDAYYLCRAMLGPRNPDAPSPCVCEDKRHRVQRAKKTCTHAYIYIKTLANFSREINPRQWINMYVHVLNYLLLISFQLSREYFIIWKRSDFSQGRYFRMWDTKSRIMSSLSYI